MNIQITLRRLLLLLPLVSLGFPTAVACQEDPFPEAPPQSQGIGLGVLESLDGVIRGWVEAERIVGAEILVIKNDRTVMHRAFGWKDREEKLPMERNTIFNIRSMTKPLVGMAVQILVEKGCLSLDDRVSDFLPTFRHAGATQITVEHLLTHRSGLPVSVAFDPESQSQTLQELAAAIGAAGPEFEPGSRFQYSDAGANVLAALVEVVSGRSLDAFVRSHLFEPLGMTGTDFLTRVSRGRIPVDRTAVLYGGEGGTWHRFWGPAEEPFYLFPMGSQSVYATPMDYARFLSLWIEGGSFLGTSIVSEETIRRVSTPVSPMTQVGSTQLYPTGFPGVEVWHGQMVLLFRDTNGPDDAPTRTLGYAGSDGTLVWAWPGEHLLVLFFSQSRGLDIRLELEATIHKLLVEPHATWATRANAPKPPVSDSLELFLGRYRAEFGQHRGTDFTVLVQGDRLAVDIPGQMVFTLSEPNEAGWRSFTLTDLISVCFRKNLSGEVEAMRMAQTSVFPKGPGILETGGSVPDSIRLILGDYELPAGQGVLKFAWVEGSLELTDPSGRVTPIGETDTPGTWEAKDGPLRRISFSLDREGKVVAMELTEIVELPRVGEERSGG